MRATTVCLSRGFWARSLDEFKRLSNIAFNLEGIKGPSGPLPLHDFHQAERLKECKVMSDADMGGFSKAALDHIPSSYDNPNGHAHFHGSISTALPPNRPEIQRSGYAGWRTLDRPPTIFGRAVWNIDMYTYLGMRIKSDGRAYLVNVQTESVVPTDLHQHRLFAKRPGEWETVYIKWNDFVRTNHGFVVEPQTEMLRQKVRSIGVGLTDRVPGVFDLFVERIWATNNPREGEGEDKHALEVKEGQLKNKQGRHINWSDK
ncbi:CIA30-domain-containing protein [Hypoxylon trugodes]|uniref:CIA30-domain-containing protein n=1 Tax=Hypoxylon trugodes TaxID=326681 RepID=UPI0021920BCB|nr:CIA30-domain-containing protein [Hypoxylon trugodes]KAI1391934.1 CIA30-domain-containing protein [Hypoxylon trugodes]